MQAKFLLTAIAAVFTLSSHAQSLEKMQWFNEPESYTIKGGTLEIGKSLVYRGFYKSFPLEFLSFRCTHRVPLSATKVVVRAA